jgi:hypothetical protein
VYPYCAEVIHGCSHWDQVGSPFRYAVRHVTVVSVTLSNFATAVVMDFKPVSVKFGSTHSRREGPTAIKSPEVVKGCVVVVVVVVVVVEVVVVEVAAGIDALPLDEVVDPIMALEGEGMNNAATVMAAMDAPTSEALAKKLRRASNSRNRRLKLNMVPITE